MLLNDSFIIWLNEFMKEKESINNLYYVCDINPKISCDDIEKLEYLNFLYVELLTYFVKDGEIISNTQPFCMRYKNRYFVLEKDDNCCYCDVYDEQLL